APPVRRPPLATSRKWRRPTLAIAAVPPLGPPCTPGYPSTLASPWPGLATAPAPVPSRPTLRGRFPLLAGMLRRLGYRGTGFALPLLVGPLARPMQSVRFALGTLGRCFRFCRGSAQ